MGWKIIGWNFTGRSLGLVFNIREGFGGSEILGRIFWVFDFQGSKFEVSKFRDRRLEKFRVRKSSENSGLEFRVGKVGWKSSGLDGRSGFFVGVHSLAFEVQGLV